MPALVGTEYVSAAVEAVGPAAYTVPPPASELVFFPAPVCLGLRGHCPCQPAAGKKRLINASLICGKW